jgi:hypothetical protein
MGDLDKEARLEREAKEKEEREHREEQKRRMEEAEARRLREAQQDPESKPDHNDQHHDDDEQHHHENRKRNEPPPVNSNGKADPKPAAQPPVGSAAEGSSDASSSPPVEARAAPATAGPSSYTLCSPQLLHLDHDGTPLWFNGWLLDNKFADRQSKKFGSFTHYLAEPTDFREPTAWQLHENNQCCLTTDADKMFVFNDKEKKLLERMMNKAREVGAPGA